MKFSFILIWLLFVSFTVEADKRRPFEVPNSTIEILTDVKTKRIYELYIKLPPDYSKSKRYPVVYLTDALYTFQVASGTTRLPVNSGWMEEIILVGISWQKDTRAQYSRDRDYTPTVEKYWISPTGEAGKHLTFINDNVIKHVEENYSADPDRRTYVGQSFGGLFGAYILLVKPETFKNYVLSSPSLWYDNKSIMKIELESAKKRSDINANVYIAVGELETSEHSSGKHDMVEAAKSFYSRLKNREYQSLQLKFVTVESSYHVTTFPTVVTQGLWWLFNNTQSMPGVSK